MKSFKQHVLAEAFTRQHYEAVAKIISEAQRELAYVSDAHPDEVIDTIAEKLATLFKQDNPRFDKGYFLSKCGV